MIVAALFGDFQTLNMTHTTANASAATAATAATAAHARLAIRRHFNRIEPLKGRKSYTIQLHFNMRFPVRACKQVNIKDIFNIFNRFQIYYRC